MNLRLCPQRWEPEDRQERQQALRSLRAALRPLPLSVGVDLVVVGTADAQRLAGSRWHVVARALREGRELPISG